MTEAAVVHVPCPGHTKIRSPFGHRIHPVTHEASFHAGCDFEAPLGAQVVAFLAGTVLSIFDWDALSESDRARHAGGNVVNILHVGQLESRHMHLSSVAAGIRPGAHVEEGQVIGEVGATGRVTGPHLHFEVRRGAGGTPVDPVTILGPLLRGGSSVA